MRRFIPLWIRLSAFLILATTPVIGQFGGFVYFSWNITQTGPVFATSPSQVLPASYLRIGFEETTFPMASVDNPMILVIRLPSGVFLSQTLATGNRHTAAPLPLAGETVIPLALEERGVMKAGLPNPPAPAAIPGANAVQLFRYVAGEQEIWIRVNEPPSSWTYQYSENTWTCTIGLGGGVWPDSENSNWGSAGVRRQDATLFFADLRESGSVSAGAPFYISFDARDQHTQTSIYTIYEPYSVQLFSISAVIEDEQPVMSAIGGEVTDFATGDLNRDGSDDICSIDGVRGRLYWTWGQPGATFAGLDWIETTGFLPSTLDLADVTGDGWLDCLVGDAAGLLHIYRWEDLFAPQAKEARTAFPVLSLTLPGAPADSTVHDMNQDGMSDYVFADKTANSLVILFGGAFSMQSSYAAGTAPIALTIADFNGDHAPDAAVANNGSSNISVYWNDGAGNLTRTDLPAGGTLPIDIDAADFDRNGQMDLVLATAGNKMLSVWKAQPSGNFDPALAKKVFFQKTPSALLADNFDGLAGPDVLLGFSDNDKLAFCTFTEAGELVHAYSINTLGDVVVDPGSGATLAESSVLSVAGGTASGGVSNRDGVAGLTQLSFDVVFFPRSQELSFSVVNLGASEALLNLELYDDMGTFKSASTQSIPPTYQFPRYFADLLGAEAANPQRWVRSFITSPDTYGLWLTSYGSTLTVLDGLRTPSITDALHHFVLPVIQSGGGRNTQWILVNPNLAQAHVTLQLIGANGSIRGTHALLLNGRGRAVIDAPVLFPGVAEDDYLVVDADRPLVGSELFGDDQKLATMEALPAGVDQGVLYSPHVAVGDFGGIVYETFLTIINTSEQTARPILTLYNDAGVEIASYPWIQLAARTKQVRDLGDLMSLPSGTTGYLKIDPQGATGLIGTITFGESGAGRFQSCLPLQSPAHNEFILGHLANGTLGDIAFFTGIAVGNIDNDTKVIGLKAYDQFGILLDSQSLTLQARARQVFLLNQVMPSLTNLFGGYLIVENKTPSAGILVFELFGDTDFTFLSAVPAVPID